MIQAVINDCKFILSIGRFYIPNHDVSILKDCSSKKKLYVIVLGFGLFNKICSLLLSKTMHSPSFSRTG